MSEASPSYPLDDIAVVIRNHVHDVRNALNGIELELSVLESDAKDAAELETIGRLRKATTEIGQLMQRVSGKYGAEAMNPVLALQLAERWKMDARHLLSNISVDWRIAFSNEFVHAESRLIRTLLLDLLETALRIAGAKQFQVVCEPKGNCAVFSIIILGASLNSGIIASVQPFWKALRNLAGRSGGSIEPECFASDTLTFSLSLPLHPSSD